MAATVETPRNHAGRLAARSASLLVLAIALAASGACGLEPGAPDAASLGAQPTPEATLRAYMRALEHGVKDPNLGLFTPETRRLLAGHTTHSDQQARELRSLRPAIDAIDVRSRGSLAVIRFPPRYRQVPPYFFRRGAEGWMLDLATPRRILVFNQANEWTFRSRDHEYAFAFDGR